MSKRKKKVKNPYEKSRAITKKELLEKIVGLSHRDKALVSILWLTGARVDEALSLKPVNFSTREEHKHCVFVRVKTLKRRKKEIPMRTVVIDLKRDADLWHHAEFYMQLRDPWQFIFTISRSQCWRIVKKFGFGKTHNFRHSAVTEWARRGVSPFNVQDMGGWASMKMLELYRHEFSAAEVANFYERGS